MDELLKICKCIETEGSVDVTRVWENRTGRYGYKSTRSTVGDDRILEVDGADGCVTLCMHSVMLIIIFEKKKRKANESVLPSMLCSYELVEHLIIFDPLFS